MKTESKLEQGIKEESSFYLSGARATIIPSILTLIGTSFGGSVGLIYAHVNKISDIHSYVVTGAAIGFEASIVVPLLAIGGYALFKK